VTRPRGPAVALLTVAALLAMAAPASAHARLLSSTPAGGSTVAEVPPEIVLEFNERIEASFGGVQVFDSAGNRIDSGEPQIGGSTVRVALGELPSPGDYTVVFRIISGDSHPVESRFAFSYRPPASSPEPSPAPSVIPPSPPAQGPQPIDIELQGAGTASTVGLWLSRLVNYISMTLVVGLLLAGLILLKQFPDAQRRALSLAGRVSLIWVLSCASLFVFGLSVAAALAVPEAVKGELPGRFAGTRFGQAVLVQGALALGTSVLALAAGKGRRKLAVLSAALAGLALFAPGSWGHAGTSKLLAIAIASDWAHLAAVTTWVGGLVVLATMVLPRSSTIEPAAPAQRFSKLAGVAVVVVLVSGAVNAAMRIDSPGQLLSTEWGKLVLVKLLLFAGIAFLGYRNRSRMLPALAADPDTARAGFRKLALVEIGIMLLSLSTATALASTIPADAEAASRIQSIATTFGPGQINLTVDPATVGENVMHLYFLDPAGQPLEVTEPSVSLAMPGTTLEARLFQAGPGHYTVLSQTIERAGTYSVAVTATVDGGRQTATGTVEIR